MRQPSSGRSMWLVFFAVVAGVVVVGHELTIGSGLQREKVQEAVAGFSCPDLAVEPSGGSQHRQGSVTRSALTMSPSCLLDLQRRIRRDARFRADRCNAVERCWTRKDGEASYTFTFHPTYTSFRYERNLEGQALGSGSWPTRADRLIKSSLPKSETRLNQSGMPKYLISFPSEAMRLSQEELIRAGIDSRAVIEEAKMAGVYVFAGGIDEGVAPVLVSTDGTARPETYPGVNLNGGFTVLELPTRQDAVEWARKIAVACRCSQEVREFMYDPAS